LFRGRPEGERVGTVEAYFATIGIYIEGEV